jgi:acyl dehydratase
MLNNRYFKDIYEGMELPEVAKGPITRNQLVDYASASGDYNKLHYDEAFAKKAGLQGPIAHGMLVMGMVGSYFTDMIKDGALKSFKIRFAGMTNENDTLTFKGKVVKLYQENNENLIEIEVTSQTQDNRITTQGSAIVSLK